VAVIEGTNVSVGRGTDSPFEQFGAPWMDGPRLAAALNARRLPGVSFYPTSFTPAAAAFKGERCGGVFMIVTDRDALQTARLGVEIASAIYRQHGATWEIDRMLALLGSAKALGEIKALGDPARIAASFANDEGKWRLLRAKYLLY
jgi:uncharacterized protein YbbC (DUF1343 family)